MKILFAVSNDNITTSVVNKYQQKYKEIITNKNVYYFNAIIKELQKNKNYDAIVIGEDLEPISNNNYEAIDKFLFEKLDTISDEAAKPTGEDIPVILICSDRRTQADGLLIKLFGIGIYNAIIGNDRSIDTVCNLINKPRNKKEAKLYYKVETDELAPYEHTSDSDVSETEIQNILAHYRKIGLNPKKCVESFDSIAGQYNDTQLRIIIKFLPKEVKAILETNSSKFQKLVNNGTVLSNGQYVAYNKDDKKEKKDILTKDLNKTNLSKPVIIPSTMNIGKKTSSSINQNASKKINQDINQNKNQNINQGVKQMNNMNQNFNQKFNNNIPGAVQGNMPFQTNAPMQGNIPMQGAPNNMNSSMRNNQPVMQNNMQRPIQGNMQGHVTNLPNNVQGILPNNQYNNIQKNSPNMPNNNLQRPVQNITNSNMQAPVQNITNSNMQTLAQNIEQNNANNNATNPWQSIPSNNINQNIQSQGLNDMNQMRIENNEIKPAVEAIPYNPETPTSENVTENTEVAPVKRGRGRPRKNPDAVVPKAVVQYDEFGNPIKRGRGRPRKQPVETQAVGKTNMPVASVGTSVTIPDPNKSIMPSPEPFANENIFANVDNSISGFEKNTIEPSNVENSTISEFDALDNIQMPGFDNAKNDTKIGFDNAVNKTETQSDTTQNSTVPEFEPIQNDDIFSSNENFGQDDDSMMPGFGLDNDLENLFSLENTEPTFTKQDSNVMPGFESGMNDNLSELNNDLFVSPYTKETKKQDDIFNMQPDKSLINTNNNASANAANNNIVAGNGKLVSFVGTSKNGTSFIVNNLAQMLSSSNVKTAILDLTQNRNSYYMFTNNDQNLMQIAVNSIKELSNGKINGVNVNRNLSVFTALPDEKIDVNINNVMKTLSNNFDITLIDCDFDTDVECFKNSNETYLIQTMDTFTIQPLTKFLSDLKLKNALDESKLRVVINKYVKLKKLNEKMVIGGMSKYNEPSMTLQRDLFNSQTIGYVTIPFETDTYAKYLENIAMCELSLNGYSQSLMNSLDELKNMVYPLIYGGNKPNSYIKQGNTEEKRGLFGGKKQSVEPESAQFTSNINDTLNKMRSNNF